MPTDRPLTAQLDHTPGDAQAVIDAARARREARVDRVEPTEVLVYRDDSGEVRELDLEHRLDAPRRAAGTYTAATLPSFIKLVKRHLDEARTTVWVHPNSGEIVAVLDDHPADGSAWGKHRARLQLITTDEWKFWTSKDGQMLGQEPFAEHIELGLKEIRNPAAADLLEIAQSFYATTSAEMRSAKRLQDGSVKVAYVEEVKASAGGSGEFEIPKQFTLGIAPFLGEEPYEVIARLRYRLNSGHLQLGYKLERPADVVRDALGQIAGRLVHEFGDRVFMGSPRS